MQNFKTLRQPLMGELAMSRKKEEREKNAIYSGHLRLCQQPRAAHALRSDQCFTNNCVQLMHLLKAHINTFLNLQLNTAKLVFYTINIYTCLSNDICFSTKSNGLDSNGAQGRKAETLPRIMYA